MTPHEFQGLVVLVDELLAAVISERHHAPGSVRSVPMWSFSRNGEHGYEFNLIAEDQIVWPSANRYQWIATLPSYGPVEQALAATEIMRVIARENASGADDIEGSLRDHVCIMIVRFVDLSLERTAWVVSAKGKEAAVGFWRSLLVSRQTTHRLFMFTHGIAVGDALDLDGLVLRAPTHEESLAAFKSRVEPYEAVLTSRAVIEAEERVPYGDRSLLGMRAAALLTALRIWSRRPVASIVTYNAERDDVFRGFLLVAPKTFWFAKDDPLDDPQGFVEFWRRTRDVITRPPNALGVALRRVDLMVEQERKTDRVLDLCIILEALFQTGDEQQELSYRLSLRAAQFVGGQSHERRQTMATVREGYKLRSKIAHGASAGSSEESVQERLEDVVFNALKRYCERAAVFPNEEAHKAIISELDGYLLERSTDR